MITFGILALGLSACTHIYTAHGVYYRLHEGDTLSKIAKDYKVDIQELAEINNIEKDEDLKSRGSIYIPGMTPNGFSKLLHEKGLLAKKEKKRTAQEHKHGKSASPDKKVVQTDSGIEIDRDRFHWPIVGEISSPYGIRHGRRHDGIDIRSPIGTPIKAAADGEVSYCKRMRGYGNIVLLKHGNDFFTVYAHNSVNLVKQGQKIKQGQVIAKVGRTGRATGPHLHFEVRDGSKPRNPLFFLPKNEFAEKVKQGHEGESAYGGSEGETESEHP